MRKKIATISSKMLSFSNWDNLWSICKTYAEEEFESTRAMRAARGQRNSTKIKHQTAVGKMGEFASQAYLQSLGHECSAPDCKVYTNKTGRKKSWDSDLIVNEHKIAVKTQDSASAKRYGESWIFQKGGNGYRGHRDPIIDKGESFVLFVTLSIGDKTARVRGPFHMSNIRKYFKAPKIHALKFSKACVYLKDIRHLKSEIIE